MLVFGFFLNFFKKIWEISLFYLFFLFGRVGYIAPYCAVCQYFFCVPFDCHPSEIIGKGDEICRPSFLGRATEPTPNHYINQKLVLNLLLSDVNCELSDRRAIFPAHGGGQLVERSASTFWIDCGSRASSCSLGSSLIERSACTFSVFEHPFSGP